MYEQGCVSTPPAECSIFKMEHEVTLHMHPYDYISLKLGLANKPTGGRKTKFILKMKEANGVLRHKLCLTLHVLLGSPWGTTKMRIRTKNPEREDCLLTQQVPYDSQPWNSSSYRHLFLKCITDGCKNVVKHGPLSQHTS